MTPRYRECIDAPRRLGPLSLSVGLIDTLQIERGEEFVPSERRDASSIRQAYCCEERHLSFLGH